MIRLTRQRRTKVSNRLAILGAVLITAALYTGFNSDRSAISELSAQQAAVTQATDSQADDTITKRKRFSVSRLLFGHG